MGQCGLRCRCRNSRGERGKETRDFGAVGEVGCAEFCGEERLFCRDEAQLDEGDGQDAEDGSAGWHEKRESKGVEEGAKVERVAEIAIGAGCHDAFAVHRASLNDGGVEIG